MKLGKLLIVVGFVGILTMLAFGSQVWGGEPPGTTPTVQDEPAYWGVVVVNCGERVATLRIKKVVDCNVTTEAVYEDFSTPVALSCPSPMNASAMVGYYFQDTGVLGESGKPIIAEAKNFEQKGTSNIYSFDALIRFCTANCP